MIGRRSQVRFGTGDPWTGDVRILREVVVSRTSRDELTAIAGTPGVPGEAMTLDLIGGGLLMTLRVRVLESRPVMVGGSVRHQIRLAVQSPVGERIVDPVQSMAACIASEAL